MTGQVLKGAPRQQGQTRLQAPQKVVAVSMPRHVEVALRHELDFAQFRQWQIQAHQKRMALLQQGISYEDVCKAIPIKKASRKLISFDKKSYDHYKRKFIKEQKEGLMK